MRFANSTMHAIAVGPVPTGQYVISIQPSRIMIGGLVTESTFACGTKRPVGTGPT